MTCAPCKTERRQRFRFAIQKPKASPTRDTSGNNAELADDANWDTVAQHNGYIVPLGGSERFASDQWQAGHSHRVEMNSDPVSRAITPIYRLRYTRDGTEKTLYVNSAAEDTAKHIVFCICSETRT